MKAKRKAAGNNWEFDGTTITVSIPITWKRRGGRKMIIAPDGGDAWAPTKPRPDETLIRALGKAHRWKRMLEECRYRSAGELAEAEGVTRSFVNRLLRLTLLAPDLVEAILDGGQPKGMHFEDLTRALPSAWGAQRQRLLGRWPAGFSAADMAADQRPGSRFRTGNERRASDVGESARLANSRGWGNRCYTPLTIPL